MRNIKQIVSSFIVITTVLSSFFCQRLDGQTIIKQLNQDNTDIIILTENDTIRLNNVLIPEVNAYYKKGHKNNFYIIYEYLASRTKSMVIYSLLLNTKEIIVNKIVHFNYNDREGIPFGWIYYCNKKMAYNQINFDKLSGLNGKIEYNSFNKNKSTCSVNIKSETSKYAISEGSKSNNKIKIEIPLFFEDGTNIGTGQFNFITDDWSSLSMAFPIDSLTQDYFGIANNISSKNIRLFNDIAYYLEQSSSFYESKTILEKVTQISPNRTVAYINLGDAYWGLKQTENARKAYQKYVELMKSSAKEAKIPKRVLERIK